MIKYGWRTDADGKGGRLGEHARTDVRAGFPAAGMCKQPLSGERCRGSLTGVSIRTGKVAFSGVLRGRM
jgi:hypothetical protein